MSTKGLGFVFIRGRDKPLLAMNNFASESVSPTSQGHRTISATLYCCKTSANLKYGASRVLPFGGARRFAPLPKLQLARRQALVGCIGDAFLTLRARTHNLLDRMIVSLCEDLVVSVPCSEYQSRYERSNPEADFVRRIVQLNFVFHEIFHPDCQKMWHGKIESRSLVCSLCLVLLISFT